MKVTAPNLITQRITQLRNELVYSAARGNYKNYKTAVKEHAKLSIENYELAKNAPAPKLEAPLFTRAGLRMLKILFFDLFRIKTPEEKKLKQLAKEARLKAEADKYIKKG